MPAQPFPALAADESPGRLQTLIAGARKEGSVTFYTSIPDPDMTVLSGDFERRYGVKVNVWRASTVNVLQRAVAESRAGRWSFDAAGISSPEMEALYREGLLQEVRSAHHADLVREAMPAGHTGWAPQFFNVFVQAYNTSIVKKEELPKSYADLLEPRWKGRLGVEANDAEWYCGVVKYLGEEMGARLFRDIVAANGWSVRSGHTLLLNLVAAGEVPLGLTVYSYRVEQEKLKGAPIEWFGLDPVIGRSNGVGVSRRPPHPHAALLFYEYLISEAQPLMAKQHYLSASRKIESPLRDIRIRFVDPAAMLDQSERCSRAFDELKKQGR